MEVDLNVRADLVYGPSSRRFLSKRLHAVYLLAEIQIVLVGSHEVRIQDASSVVRLRIRGVLAEAR